MPGAVYLEILYARFCGGENPQGSTYSDKYLYRVVDSAGNTLDFMLSAKRDGKAAERFFRKVLKAKHTQVPRVITVDKNAAYPKAIETLKADETRS